MATSTGELSPAQSSRSARDEVYLYPGNGLAVSIICLVGGMIISVALIGYRSPFWARAASDIVSAYEGLLYNDRLPQEFLAYPALLSGQLLGLWYRLLHAVGMLPIDRVSELPKTLTVPQFDAIWQSLVNVARAYVLVLAVAYVTIFTLLVNRLVRVWQVAALAGFALAFSSGVALEFRIIRSELPSSALIFIGLLSALLAAREPRQTLQLAWLGLAGLCTALGYVEKVQALLPALALPIIALAFPPMAPRTSPAAAGDCHGDWHKARILAVTALVPSLPVLWLMIWGIAARSTGAYIPYPPLASGLSGIYQWLIPAGVIACMLLYGRIWRIPMSMTAAAVCAVMCGLALGLGVAWLRYNPQVVVALANPLEHLQAHAGAEGAGLPTGSAAGIAGKLVGSLMSALAIHSFVLYPSHRPTLIIEWLTIAAAVILWHRGDRLRVLQIALLLAAGVALDGLFTLRQYKVFYLPFTDPFIVIAGSIAAAPFLQWLVQRNVQYATMALLAVYIAWGHAQPVRFAYGDMDKAGKICVVVAQFTSRISWPYCKP